MNFINEVTLSSIQYNTLIEEKLKTPPGCDALLITTFSLLMLD